jgi:anti-anti-sigma regulatory factor
MADPPPLPDSEANTVGVILPDEIDMARACRVGEDLDGVFGPGVGVVVADLSGTRFCDTSGIYALVMAYKRAKTSNTRVPGRV